MRIWVDDEPVVRESLASSLGFGDHDVVTTTGGLTALGELDRSRPA